MGVVYGPPLRSARQDIVSAAEGFITQEPDSLGVLTGTAVLTGSMIVAGLVGLRAGELASTITMYMTVNGASLSFGKFALLDTAGNRLAVSAESNATFTSGAPKMCSLAMIAPYVVPADGAYYAAVLVIGTTGPTLVRGNSSFDTPGMPGKPRRFARLSGQTDIQPATALGVGGPAYWFAVS